MFDSSRTMDKGALGISLYSRLLKIRLSSSKSYIYNLIKKNFKGAEISLILQSMAPLLLNYENMI